MKRTKCAGVPDYRMIATLQRWLLWAIVAQIATSFSFAAGLRATRTALLVFAGLAIVVLIGIVIVVVMLTIELRWHAVATTLTSLGIVFFSFACGLVSLFLLLVVNQSATSTLRTGSGLDSWAYRRAS